MTHECTWSKLAKVEQTKTTQNTKLDLSESLWIVLFPLSYTWLLTSVFSHHGFAVTVTSQTELEDALEDGFYYIELLGDIVLNRTITIQRSVRLMCAGDEMLCTLEGAEQTSDFRLLEVTGSGITVHFHNLNFSNSNVIHFLHNGCPHVQ
jgi:hypothetical protein